MNDIDKSFTVCSWCFGWTQPVSAGICLWQWQ